MHGGAEIAAILSQYCVWHYSDISRTTLSRNFKPHKMAGNGSGCNVDQFILC